MARQAVAAVMLHFQLRNLAVASEIQNGGLLVDSVVSGCVLGVYLGEDSTMLCGWDK